MFLSESLMFEGRLSKTGWQRPEFEPNNPKFIKKRGTWPDLRLTILFARQIQRKGLPASFQHILKCEATANRQGGWGVTLNA